MRPQLKPKTTPPRADDVAPVATDEFAIYGDIGMSWWGDYTTAADVRDWLRGRDSSARLTVRINSPGGDAFEGLAIYNLLRDTPQHITTKIDGVALSAASIVAMGGDEVHMAENSLMMIHDPWTIAMGNAGEMRATADKLDKVGEALATTYARKTGQDSATMRELMTAETWFSAAEAKAEGLVDVVDGPPAEEPAPAASALGERPWLRQSRARAAHNATAAAHPAASILSASAIVRGANEDIMDLKEVQAALDKANQEIGAVKRECADASARAEKAEANAKAYETQNAALVVERDAAVAKAKTYEDSEAERVVDALVGVKFTAAERADQVELCRTNRALFNKLSAQRAPLTILQHNPAGVSASLPDTTLAHDDSQPDAFDRAVAAMPLD